MAWSVLQSASNAPNGNNIASVTYGSNVSAGTTLVVLGVVYNTSANTTSVKDGAGNSFILIGESSGQTFATVNLWALNTPAGDVGTKPTITITGKTGSVTALLVQEVSGLATGTTAAQLADGTAAVLDGVNTTGGTFGPAGYGSTAANEYLVLTYGDSGNGLTVTPSSGYTLDANSINTSGVQDVLLAYKNSSNGTETGQWTIPAGTVDYGMILGAFKLAPSGVTFDAVGPSSSGATSATSPLTWSHTCGASATELLVGVSVDAGSDTGITAAATYNGLSMTPVQKWESGGPTENFGFIQVFSLANPPTGAAHTVSVSVSGGAPPDGMSGGSLSFAGSASLGTPVTADSGGAAVTSGSVSVLSQSSRSQVAAFVTTGSGLTTFTAGTQQFKSGLIGGAAAEQTAAATSAGTGSTVAVSWTQASDFYGAVAIEILPPAGSSAPDLPSIQPGPTWRDLFKPGLPKPRPLVNLAYIPPPGTSAAVSGLPSIQPGPTWRDLFKPGLPKPRPLTLPAYAPPAEQGTLSIPLPVPVLAFSCLDTLPLDQPQVQPGPVWLDLFKPALPKSRPIPPAYAPPAEQGTFSIILPLPALSLSGLDTLTTDQPALNPGPVWLDLFKPALPKSRPIVPAYAPPGEQGTFNIALPVPATALNGLDTLTIDQPAVQPGPVWLDLFKPALPKPRPLGLPVYITAGEQGTFSIVLPVPATALTGLDTLTTDQPSVQPGPVWLDRFKPALPKPRPLGLPSYPPLGTSTESGAFVIELPPGFRYQNDFGPFTLSLPVPATSLSAVTVHDGYFAVTLPVPSTAISAVTNSGPFNITLPSPSTALSGAVAHDGYFAVTLPVPVTSLNSLDPPTETGPFSITLPVPATALSGPLVHQGLLHISFGVPLPRLTRYEMFGCESRADIPAVFPVPVLFLAARVPDPPGQRSYFKAGRWISARVPDGR